MIKTIENEINLSPILKKKLNWAKNYTNTTLSVKKGALIRLEPTNIAYVKPHEVLVNNIKFLFFNNTDFFCINDLDNRYKLSDLEEILKLVK